MSLEYITPVYDRTEGDVYIAQNTPDSMTKGAWNYTDLNRIENNTRYVADIMLTNGITDTYITLNSKYDWTMEDIPTQSDINRIINNVLALEALSVTGLEFETLVSGSTITYRVANAIEYNLEVMRTQEAPAEDTYSLTVINGSGSGYYANNTVVNISADLPPENKIFWVWSGEAECLARVGDLYSASTTYTMFTTDDEITANFATGVAHLLTIDGGTITDTGETTGYYYYGDIVKIKADTAPEDKVFYEWLGSYDVSASDDEEEEDISAYSGNPYASTTYIIMPDATCTVTGKFVYAGDHTLTILSGTITSDPDDDKTSEEDSEEDTSAKTTGNYSYKEQIGISADSPPNDKYEFATWYVWEGSPESLDKTSSSTTLSMGDTDTTVSARYNYIYESDLELQVVQASGSGTYNEGDTVDIYAFWIFDTSDYVVYPYGEDNYIGNTGESGLTLATCRTTYAEATEGVTTLDDSDFCVTAWGKSAALTERQQRMIDPSYGYETFTAGTYDLYPGYLSFIDDDGNQWYYDETIDTGDEEETRSPWFYIASDAETEIVQVSWESESEDKTETNDDGEEEIVSTTTTYSFVGPNNLKYYYKITTYYDDDDESDDDDEDVLTYTVSNISYSSPNYSSTLVEALTTITITPTTCDAGDSFNITIDYINANTSQYTDVTTILNAEYTEVDDPEANTTDEDADIPTHINHGDSSYEEGYGGTANLTLTIGTEETAEPLTLLIDINFYTGYYYRIGIDFERYSSADDPKNNPHIYTDSGEFRTYLVEKNGELQDKASTVYVGYVTLDGVITQTYILDSIDQDPKGNTYMMYYNNKTCWYYSDDYPKTYADKVTKESIISNSNSKYGSISYPDGATAFCKNHIKFTIPDYDVELACTVTYAPWRTIKTSILGTITSQQVRMGDKCTLSTSLYAEDYTLRFSHWAFTTTPTIALSTSQVYTFTVSEDVSIIGVYEDNAEYTVTCDFCTITETGKTTGTYWRRRNCLYYSR